MPDPTDVILVQTSKGPVSFPAGTSVATMKKALHQLDPQPIDPNEPDTYAGGFLKGAKEGAAGGAKGFAEGVGGGLINGVKNIAGLPIAVLREGIDTLVGMNNFAKDPQKSLDDALEALKGVPSKLADGLQSLQEMATTDPEAFGKVTGDITGQMMAGVAASKLVPLVPKPFAQKVGSALEDIGKKGQLAFRFMGAHQIASGNVIGGVSSLLTPEMLTKTGGALRSAGGMRVAPAEAAALEGKFSDAMSKRNLSFYDEQQNLRTAGEKQMQGELKTTTKEVDAEQAAKAKADANAAKLDTITKAREGLEPQKPTFGTSVSAETPEGGRATMSQQFKVPDDAVGDGPVDPKKLGVNLTPEEVAQKLRQVPQKLTGQSLPDPTLDRTNRPPIRIAPSPDLAKMGVVPPAPAPVAPKIIDVPGTGGRRFQTVAPIAPTPLTNRPDLTPVGGEAEFNAQRPAPAAPVVPEPTSALEAVKRDARENPDLVRNADAMKAKADAARIDPDAPVVPASKSRRSASGVAGLSTNDMQALTDIARDHPDWSAEQVSAELVKQRAQRSATHRYNGAMDRQGLNTMEKAILRHTTLPDEDE